MNLLCPNCQNPLSVPEHYAGQLMKCPLCANNFTVPPMPKETPEPALGISHESDQIEFTPIDLSGQAPAASQAPQSAPVATAEEGHEVYGLTPEPKRTAPPPPPPPRPAAVQSAAPSAPPPPKTISTPPRSSVPSGYTHTMAFTVNPNVLPWVAPASLLVVFLLSFFPWVGYYPGGHGIVTQSAWGAAFGGYSLNDDYDKVAKWEEKTPSEQKPGFGALMFFFLLLGLFPAVLVAAFVAALPHLKNQFQLPPGLAMVEPWRWLIVAGLTGIALFFLLLQVVTSFSIESRTRDRVAQKFAKDRTDRKAILVDIAEGKELASYGLERTGYLRLSLLLLIVALGGALATHWIEQRGPGRPLPRFEVLW